jgi:hypothetical protein
MDVAWTGVSLLEGLSTRLMPHTPPSSTTTTALAALLVFNAPLLLLLSLVVAWVLSLLALLVVPALFAVTAVVVLLRCAPRSFRGPPNTPLPPARLGLPVRRDDPAGFVHGALRRSRFEEYAHTDATRSINPPPAPHRHQPPDAREATPLGETPYALEPPEAGAQWTCTADLTCVERACGLLRSTHRRAGHYIG